MPWTWKIGLGLLVACLLASMAIAIVRLATTPTEIIGSDFHGVRELRVEPSRHASGVTQP